MERIEVEILRLFDYRVTIITINFFDQIVCVHSRRGNGLVYLFSVEQKLAEILPALLDEKPILAVGFGARPASPASLEDFQSLLKSLVGISFLWAALGIHL